VAKGEGGGGGGSNNFLNYVSLFTGFLFGMAADYAWFAYDLPGARQVRFQDPQLSNGDFFQLILETMIAFYGFTSSHKLLAPFGFGMLNGGLYSKIWSEAVPALPRYLITDTLGGTSILTAPGISGGTAAKRKTGQAI